MNKDNNTVLCIDDEEMLRVSLSDYLEDSGYVVYQAENGKIGLEMFREKLPDIVLVDLRMPEVGGLEVLATITKDSPETPVIVVSGAGEMRDVIEALRLGAWDYITKPIEDMAILELAVETCLERSRIIRENREYKENLEKLVDQRTKELWKAKEAAEASNRAKSKFLTTVSHELRTPLTGILGYTQLFKFDTNLTDQQQERIDAVLHCGEHLLMMINDILDMSKIETQEMILVSTTFHLVEQLKSIEEIANIQARQKGITFICDIASDIPPVVSGDEYRLRQILLNILGNAIKFTKEGKVVFRVGLQIADSEDLKSKISRVRFEVEDTGIGIPPEEMESIFEPFYQAGDRLLKPDGTGLGLAISRHLAYMMGSQLQIQSTPGQGSIFWFDVDFRDVDDNDEEI